MFHFNKSWQVPVKTWKMSLSGNTKKNSFDSVELKEISKNMPFKNFYIFLLTAPYKSLSRNFTRQRIRKFVNYCSSQISANDPEHTLTTLSFNGKYQN